MSSQLQLCFCIVAQRLGGACHTFTETFADIGATWLSRAELICCVLIAARSIEEFHFESGPSLYSGLSLEASPSQLKHVFQIIGKDQPLSWSHGFSLLVVNTLCCAEGA